MFHDNTEIIPPGYPYELSLGNFDYNEDITIVLFGISNRNKFGWTEVANQ